MSWLQFIISSNTKNWFFANADLLITSRYFICFLIDFAMVSFSVFTTISLANSPMKILPSSDFNDLPRVFLIYAINFWAFDAYY